MEQEGQSQDVRPGLSWFRGNHSNTLNSDRSKTSTPEMNHITHLGTELCFKVA